MSTSCLEIKHKNKLVAMVIRANHHVDNLKFFTPEHNPLQVGLHHKAAGVKVTPHVHRSQNIQITEVHEVFYIIEGKVRLTMYSAETGEKIRSVILKTGDSAVHMGEGHGLDFLERTLMFEVKQGPYQGVKTDKVYLR
jgi:oxalate decarboxylase/phosphoglucose isomerase-like protein (cupin superfamily)